MKKQIFLIIAFFISAHAFGQVADSAKRHVVLQGAANFRDLGGYETMDGHHVKWGEIYRSADISKLTDADLAVLKQRDITYDVDLRGHREQAQAPDRLNPGTDYILLPAGSDGGLANWSSQITKVKGTGGDSLMMVFYSNIDSITLRYKPFFEKLLVLPKGQALVFHCSAGKDRTGIGAALLLYALGVPYNTIVGDYEATNYYRKDANAKMTAQFTQMHIDPQVAAAMGGAKKEYLDATFSAIKARYGSVDNYLKTQIGLDDGKMAVLKRKFLE
jgi:protein-tyrosine phosphatase